MKKLLVSLLMVMSASAFAWEPTKPIEAIMAWTPGSVNELSFRVLAKEVEKNTGAKFIVINRAGAGGVIGTEELAKKPADGYYVTNVSVPGIAAMDKVSVPEKRGYTTDSFVYPTHIASSPFVVVAHPKDPINTPAKFVETLKSEKVTVAASGGARLVYEALSVKLNIKEGADGVVRVDHKGPMDALMDVAGGNVRFAIVPSVVAYPLHKDGKVTIIAVSSKPIKQLSEVQPLSSAVQGFDISGMWALMLPAGTPADIVEWYRREFTKAMKSEEAKEIFEKNLLSERVDLQNPKSIKNWVKTREIQWQPLIDKVLSKMK